MIVVELRQGIGLDIEFNDTICHIIDDGGPQDKLFSYSGILLKLPFLSNSTSTYTIKLKKK